MVKASKHPASKAPRITLGRRKLARTPNEKTLFRVRIRELDREFARQTKQLTLITKQLKKKLTKHHKPDGNE